MTDAGPRSRLADLNRKYVIDALEEAGVDAAPLPLEMGYGFCVRQLPDGREVWARHAAAYGDGEPPGWIRSWDGRRHGAAR